MHSLIKTNEYTSYKYKPRINIYGRERLTREGCEWEQRYKSRDITIQVWLQVANVYWGGGK